MYIKVDVQQRKSYDIRKEFLLIIQSEIERELG